MPSTQSIIIILTSSSFVYTGEIEEHVQLANSITVHTGQAKEIPYEVNFTWMLNGQIFLFTFR